MAHPCALPDVHAFHTIPCPTLSIDGSPSFFSNPDLPGTLCPTGLAPFAHSLLHGIAGRPGPLSFAVYALWAWPAIADACPAWHIFSPASQFLLNGSGRTKLGRLMHAGLHLCLGHLVSLWPVTDLMLPGVVWPSEGPPAFLAKQMFVVKVIGNPMPMAVGSALLSCDQAKAAGMKGKGLLIAHCFGDGLWCGTNLCFCCCVCSAGCHMWLSHSKEVSSSAGHVQLSMLQDLWLEV